MLAKDREGWNLVYTIIWLAPSLALYIVFSLDRSCLRELITGIIISFCSWANKVAKSHYKYYMMVLEETNIEVVKCQCKVKMLEGLRTGAITRNTLRDSYVKDILKVREINNNHLKFYLMNPIYIDRTSLIYWFVLICFFIIFFPLIKYIYTFSFVLQHCSTGCWHRWGSGMDSSNCDEETTIWKQNPHCFWDSW